MLGWNDLCWAGDAALALALALAENKALLPE